MRVALEFARPYEQAVETLIATTDIVGAEIHHPAIPLAVHRELAEVRTGPKIAVAFVAGAIPVDGCAEEAEVNDPGVRAWTNDLIAGRALRTRDDRDQRKRSD